MRLGLRGLREAVGPRGESAVRESRATASMKGLLHVRFHDCQVLGEKGLVAVLFAKRLSGTEVGDWKELDRIYVDKFDGKTLHTFQALFQSGEEKLIRIELRQVTDPNDSKGQPKFQGAAEMLMMQVWDSQSEWSYLKLKETGLPNGVARPRISVILEPLKNMNHVVSLDVSVKIRKKKNWPFSSSRPFYIVYRSELDGTWNPLYRSEILLRPNERKGVMRFKAPDLKCGTLNDYNDNRPIKIEFLHYKLHGNAPRVIGHVETSISALRQAAINSKLNLQLEDLAEGELDGKLVLRESSVSASISRIVLEACFGAVEPTTETGTVFLDINCTVERTDAWPFTSSRLFFVVSRIWQNRNEVFYTSEVVSKSNGEGVRKFELVTLRRFSPPSLAEGQDPIVKIEFFHYKSSGDHRLLGHVSTTLETLRQVPPQGMLLFHSNVIPEGSIRGKVSVEQAEVSAAKSFFVLNFKFGRTDVRRRIDPPSLQSTKVTSARA